MSKDPNRQPKTTTVWLSMSPDNPDEIEVAAMRAMAMHGTRSRVVKIVFYIGETPREQATEYIVPATANILRELYQDGAAIIATRRSKAAQTEVGANFYESVRRLLPEDGNPQVIGNCPACGGHSCVAMYDDVRPNDCRKCGKVWE